MDTTEELTEFEDRIDEAHVRRRVEDWVARIDALYASIRGWLPEGWTADVSRSVPMHEELMRRFGLPERRLPVLSLRHRGMTEMEVVPRDLWVIGNNGRIDVRRGDEIFPMKDLAEHLEPPDWRIAPFMDRLYPRKFDRAYLESLLA